MAATLGGEKHPPGRVASACGAGSDEPEERWVEWGRGKEERGSGCDG